jgi:riboflavin transporter FmnP
MQLFLIVFAPGMLVCWLYFRNRASWGHAIIGMILGAVTSYGVIYLLGNYVQADLIAETRRQFGEQLGTSITNAVYSNALKYAVGTIVACSIAIKLKKASKSQSV